MNLYIWNLEYEVAMSIADSLEEAREIIQKQNAERELALKQMYDEITNKKKGSDYLDAYSTYSNLCETNSYFEKQDLQKVLDFQPDIILPANEKMARLYTHSNA